MSDTVFTRFLAAGPRIRLRLARPADAAAAARCLGTRSELEWRRALRHNPANRTVLVACALVDGTDRMVGIGAIDHAPGARPDLVVVDATRTDGLAELLAGELSARARRRVA